MGPEELAERHPRLFHLARPGTVEGVRRHGLLPAQALVELFGVGGVEARRLTRERRPEAVRLADPNRPELGEAWLGDNSPLLLGPSGRCLDDGLTAEDWLAMLDARVFFWVDEAGLSRLRESRRNRGRPREVLVFDTLSLVRAHAERVELSPINSGASVRRAARRGLDTFTPLGLLSHADWQRRRNPARRDRVLEVTVRGGVADAAEHLVEVRG